MLHGTGAKYFHYCILIGLPVTDPRREEVDLKVYVQEHCCDEEDGDIAGSIYDLLDKQGGAWTNNIVDGLYNLSCQCLEFAHRKCTRMDGILSELERLCQISDIQECNETV
jgi:hypothetical protein